MSLTLPGLLRALVVGALAAGLGMTTSCSGGGTSNNAACTSMQQSITRINRTAISQVDDPAALAKTYHDNASSIRDSANGASGSVKSAGLQVADALDSLGTAVQNLSTSTTPQIPDATPLTNAGIALKKACT
jgi:hypothetical protein